VRLIIRSALWSVKYGNVAKKSLLQTFWPYAAAIVNAKNTRIQQAKH